MILLVGTKLDMRNDPETTLDKKEFVTTEEGNKLAKEIGAIGFMECSARTKEGVTEIFSRILDQYFHGKKGGSPAGTNKKGTSCLIL